MSHMKAGFVNDPKVGLTTLKLRAHTCPKWLCKDTPAICKDTPILQNDAHKLC